MNESMMHFDSEPHKKTKRLKTSIDDVKVYIPQTMNLTDINNTYFKRESMEKGNRIKNIISQEFASNTIFIPDVSIEESRFHVKFTKFFS